MTLMNPAPDIQDTQHDTAAQELQTGPVTPTVPTTPTPRSAVPVGQPPITPPASIGQGWNWFLRILGVVIAFAAGVAYAYALGAAWGQPEAQATGWLILFGFVGIVLGVAVAAGLFRSWWALLIVTVVFYVGYVVQPLFTSSFDFQLWIQFLNPVTGLYLNPIALLFILSPAFVGAVLGVPIGKWVEQRLRH